MLPFEEKALYIHAINGIEPDTEYCLKMEDKGFMRYCGDGGSEGWKWDIRKLKKLSLEQLRSIYADAVSSDLSMKYL